jgi:hypothetical protein
MAAESNRGPPRLSPPSIRPPETAPEKSAPDPANCRGKSAGRFLPGFSLPSAEPSSLVFLAALLCSPLPSVSNGCYVIPQTTNYGSLMIRLCLRGEMLG